MLSYSLIILAQILSVILTIFYWLIIIRAVLSWVNPDPYNPIVNFLYRITEPVLAPIRKALPLGLNYGIDLSPIIAFFIIIFLKSLLVRVLLSLAVKLRT